MVWFKYKKFTFCFLTFSFMLLFRQTATTFVDRAHEVGQNNWNLQDCIDLANDL